MDAQPDFKKLSEAFTTSSTALAAASHEIALVVNVPTFNGGQRLFEAIERLTTSVDNLRTDVNNLRTDVNNLRTDVNNLRIDVNTLTTDVNTMRTDMNSKFDSLELRLRAESA